ncbi:hypothetical protein PHMEG_00033425, partial [Phytophthora megakarya]
LGLWIFSTEQYYVDSQEDMTSNTSVFVNLIFGNLGPTAQTWYQEFKTSLSDRPATWVIFKEHIRQRFRGSDFQHKLLSKLYNLRWAGSQQAYTTKLQHLLSQLEDDLPEGVKRWVFSAEFESRNERLCFPRISQILYKWQLN